MPLFCCRHSNAIDAKAQRNMMERQQLDRIIKWHTNNKEQQTLNERNNYKTRKAKRMKNWYAKALMFAS
jgi:hypothetical protein